MRGINMKLAELVFIPSPGRGHLMATIEMAKLLLHRDERLSITVLVIKPFFESNSISHQRPLESDSRLRFVDLPKPDLLPMSTDDPVSSISQFIDSHKDHVRETVAKIVDDPSSSSFLAGFVVDMFCTSMIDVANEFGVPSYVFFTSGAATLGLMFHFQGLRDDENQDISVYEHSGLEISIPSYKNPVPAKLLPEIIFHGNGTGSNMFMNLARRFRETRGILINTFSELESFALKSLSDDQKIPRVYPVGPILDANAADNDENPKYEEIMKWLDQQPDSSVVFLCFGSRGCFDQNQAKEIAIALEQSGHHFLWSLRKPPTNHKFASPGEYEDPEEVLPKGFVQRTSGRGKVIGWAPQMAVLWHRALGGFVSHCGWNSTLESVSCGVPMAAWPMYAEQQVNAFELVRDLGVAVEIKMDYKKGGDVIVKAEEIENGIRRLMEPGMGIRMKIEEMKVKSRVAMVEGGSSFSFLGRFIESVVENIQD